MCSRFSISVTSGIASRNVWRAAVPWHLAKETGGSRAYFKLYVDITEHFVSQLSESSQLTNTLIVDCENCMLS